MGLLSLCGGLWSGLTSLSTKNPWGTVVPPTTPNWQCDTSHHFGNAGYHPATGVVGRELMLAAFIPGVLEMSASLMGMKWQYNSSNQGASMTRLREEETAELDDTPKEPLHTKWKEGRPAVRPLKGNHQVVFSKESDLVRAARQAYYQTHWPNYELEGSYDLSSTLREMATSAYLMGTEVHEVQEA